MKKYILITFLLLLLVNTSNAQLFDQPKVVTISTVTSGDKVQRESDIQVALGIKIKEGYHINANKTLDEFLIPSEVKLEAVDDVSFGKINFPKPKLKEFGFSDKKLAVYDNLVYIIWNATLSPNFTKDELVIKGRFGYQACNDNSCLAPMDENFEIKIPVAEKDESITPIHAEIFKQGNPTTSQEKASDEVSYTTDELRAKRIIERGLPYAIIAFFLIHSCNALVNSGNVITFFAF